MTFDPAASEHYTVADPDDPKVGTARGPGRRPGARKPGRKKKQRQRGELVPYTPEERRAAMQARIKKEVARSDFSRRAVELRREGHTYVEIAQLMSVERCEPINAERVRRAYLNEIRNVEALGDVRAAEYDFLSSQAASLRKKLTELDANPGIAIDLEVYAKVADTYLKYRERIAKLLGLDAPVKQQIDRGQGFSDGGTVHIGADGITVHMPGSVSAYEDWVALSEKGLTDVAAQVLELEASEHEEVALSSLGMRDDKAGVTLRPDVVVTPGAERKPQPISALDALAMLDADNCVDDANDAVSGQS